MTYNSLCVHNLVTEANAMVLPGRVSGYKSSRTVLLNTKYAGCVRRIAPRSQKVPTDLKQRRQVRIYTVLETHGTACTIM